MRSFHLHPKLVYTPVCGSVRREGVTLVECLIAIGVLAIATAAIMRGATSSHVEIQSAELSTRAVRVGESLLEEILSRPWSGGGGVRSTWSMDSFHGYTEEAGMLVDAGGAPLGPLDQVFRRHVEITSDSVDVASFGGEPLSGRLLQVRVDGPMSVEAVVTRFVVEPVQP